MIQLKVLLNGTLPNSDQAKEIDNVFKPLLNITRNADMPVTQTYKQAGKYVLVKLAHTDSGHIILSCRFGPRGGMTTAGKQQWL